MQGIAKASFNDDTNVSALSCHIMFKSPILTSSVTEVKERDFGYYHFRHAECQNRQMQANYGV